MHEMGIASSILDAVRVEAARHPGAQLRKVAVRIGELTAVDPSARQFCFEALIRETELQSLELEIDRAAEENAHRIYPGMEIIRVSCTTGDGHKQWLAWLEHRERAQQAVRAEPQV